MYSYSIFVNKKNRNIVIAIVLLIGLVVRLIDLTDLPLDFHPTRQLFSATKARGIFAQESNTYTPQQKKFAVEQWKQEPTIEPPLIENLSALTYRLTGEQLWIGRAYSILFWIFSGLFLYSLAFQVFGFESALIVLAFYIFLPYGVIASRSFQPDPLMVSLMVVSLWAFNKWKVQRNLQWALITGLMSGMTIFVKNVSVFPLLGAYAAAILIENDFLSSIKNKQVWILAILTALPAVFYTIYGVFVARFLDSQFTFRFFPSMWLTPGFYYQWLLKINQTVSLPAFILGLIGLWLAESRRERPFLFGLWLGYAAYGFTFPYHFTTHDYYQLSLIPIVALSLAPVIRYVLKQLQFYTPAIINQYLFFVLFGAGCVFAIVYAGNTLLKTNYRPQQKKWENIAAILGNKSAVALTDDYGQSLAYFGWHSSANWLQNSDLSVRALAGRDVASVKSRFNKITKDKSFFVVTDFNEFAQEPELRSLLYNNYPVYAQENGYVIFNLKP